MTTSVPLSLEDRELTRRKHWDEKKQRWYRVDKASRERVYKNPKTGEWYIIDRVTGEEVHI